MSASTFRGHLETLDRPAFDILPAFSSRERVCDPIIESDIPLPSSGRCVAAMLRTVFGNMKLSDSFIWNGEKDYPHKIAKLAGIKVASRKIACGGWRYWRIS